MMTTATDTITYYVVKLADEWEWPYRRTVQFVCTRPTVETAAHLLGLDVDAESNASEGHRETSRAIMRDVQQWIKAQGYAVPRMTDGSRRDKRVR